ncbi:hypothetical protein HT031_001685 [Scenedesmus sp. PABB004]|nr:hypothetical protein HT031_001685 [Scenedesmus sp. PABB004]
MSRAAEPILLQLPCLVEQSIVYARPQRVVPRGRASASPAGVSGLTQSLSFTAVPGASEAELLDIMAKPASDGPATCSYLGVSPPVRSGCYGGAANPWSHDRSWKSRAYSASSTNLAALRELDSEGESFLRAKDCGPGAVVLGVPAPPPPPAAEPAPAPSGGGCAPFACHTAYFLG